MSEQESRGGLLADTRVGMNVAIKLAQVLAAVPEVLLHRRIGHRYIGTHTLLGMVLLFFWAGLGPQSDPMPLFGILIASMFACFSHRMANLFRGREPALRPHSYYTGYPWLCVLIPRLGEIPVKLAVEPALLFLIGLAVHPLNAALGGWLMASGAGLCVSVAVSVLHARGRIDDVQDALFEQQDLTQRLRSYRSRR